MLTSGCAWSLYVFVRCRRAFQNIVFTISVEVRVRAHRWNAVWRQQWGSAMRFWHELYSHIVTLLLPQCYQLSDSAQLHLLSLSHCKFGTRVMLSISSLTFPAKKLWLSRTYSRKRSLSNFLASRWHRCDADAGHGHVTEESDILINAHIAGVIRHSNVSSGSHEAGWRRYKFPTPPCHARTHALHHPLTVINCKHEKEITALKNFLAIKIQ